MLNILLNYQKPLYNVKKSNENKNQLAHDFCLPVFSEFAAFHEKFTGATFLINDLLLHEGSTKPRLQLSAE